MEIRDIVAPDLDTRQKIHNKLTEVSYYLIVGLISIIVMFVIPILTGCLYGDISMAFPKTAEGWILWCLIKIGSAAANVAIFVLFKQQARINVKDNDKYKEALSKVTQIRSKNWKPRSPGEMNRKEYMQKGTTVFITSLITSITIASLLISFDFVTFLSCVISTIIAVIFGWTTMLKNENYWIEEFPLWVEYKFNQESVKTEGGNVCLNSETKSSETCKSK